MFLSCTRMQNLYKLRPNNFPMLCSFFLLMCHTTFLQLKMAEECLLHALDLSGLLLLYSSIGDADGITKLASMAKEQGKNNVAFLCLFMLGKLEECLQLLIERYDRFSETVLFHTSLLQTCYCMFNCATVLYTAIAFRMQHLWRDLIFRAKSQRL